MLSPEEAHVSSTHKSLARIVYIAIQKVQSYYVTRSQRIGNIPRSALMNNTESFVISLYFCLKILLA